MKNFQNLIWVFAFVLSACSAPDTASDEAQEGVLHLSLDIQDLCNALPDKYYYFKDKKTDWSAACERAQNELSTASSSADRLAVLERLIESLYDPHLTLGVNSASSPQLLPSGMDIATKIIDSRLTITGVRQNSPAASAGLAVDDIIHSVNGAEVHKAIVLRIGGELVDAEQYKWGIQALLAGYRDQTRHIEYERNGVISTIELAAYKSQQAPTLVSAQRFENIGVIRINNSLGQSGTIELTKDALKGMTDVSGLIIDLRDTPSGGNTSVAEPILGMFIDNSKPYQETVYRDNTTMLATPRGELLYDMKKPIIVLVGRWTGSMGEGMAIGFHGTGRALVMGDHMGGLAGGTERLDLKRTNIAVGVPSYDLRHIDGTPRHKWRIAHRRPADFGNGEDLLLGAAIAQLKQVK